MLGKSGHGLLLVQDAQSLANHYGGSLASVPLDWFHKWVTLGFSVVLLKNLWTCVGDKANRSNESCNAYFPKKSVGGSEGLAAFRQQANVLEILIVVDFCANHVGADHALTYLRPDWLIAVSDGATSSSDGWTVREIDTGEVWSLAWGKDPNFPPIPNTQQLNTTAPQLANYWGEALLRLSTLSDGVFCSHAMLSLPESIKKTWGDLADPGMGGARLKDSPWPAMLSSARDLNPHFIALAEVFWGLEWDLMEQGFNFCLDQRLMERVEKLDLQGIADHLGAGWEYSSRTIHRWPVEWNAPVESNSSSEWMRWLLFLMTPGLKWIDSGFFDQIFLKPTNQSLSGQFSVHDSLEWAKALENASGFQVLSHEGNSDSRQSGVVGFAWSFDQPEQTALELSKFLVVVANNSNQMIYGNIFGAMHEPFQSQKLNLARKIVLTNSSQQKPDVEQFAIFPAKSCQIIRVGW